MPKMKSNRSAKKRFRMTKNGIIKRGCQNRIKHLTKKSSKRKMRLGKGGVVADAIAPAIAIAIKD